MADQGPGIGRVCPKCGRRVPRAVAKCRCGAVLPADDVAADEPTEERSQPWLVYLALIALVAGAGYWTYLRPPAQTVTTTSRPDVVALQPSESEQASTGRRELSAEQRAWNREAQLSESTKRGAAPNAEPIALSEPAVAPAGSLEEMVDAAMPAIVLVETSSGRGSAFFVTSDTLVTNVHVVQQDQYVTLRRMNGSSITARVQTRAPNFDIAILKVQASASQAFLPMATAHNLRPGQEVVIIGSALGTLQNSVSRGIVSGLRNSAGVTLIQSDAAANPGNSGGPMLDRNGRVVGILTAGYRDNQGLNFAVSIDHARDILEGRETNLGTGAPKLGNIETAVPGRSESDRRSQQGEQMFQQKVGSAEQAAARLDVVWQRFRSICYKNPMLPRHDREWFALFVPGGIPGDAAAGCIDYYQDMQGEMMKFRTFMKTTVDEARRANVLPGTIRDTLRAKRLNFDY